MSTALIVFDLVERRHRRRADQISLVAIITGGDFQQPAIH